MFSFGLYHLNHISHNIQHSVTNAEKYYSNARAYDFNEAYGWTVVAGFGYSLDILFL